MIYLGKYNHTFIQYIKLIYILVFAGTSDQIKYLVALMHCKKMIEAQG